MKAQRQMRRCLATLATTRIAVYSVGETFKRLKETSNCLTFLFHFLHQIPTTWYDYANFSAIGSLCCNVFSVLRNLSRNLQFILRIKFISLIIIMTESLVNKKCLTIYEKPIHNDFKHLWIFVGVNETS